MRADGLEKEMMLACGEGRRRRGQPRKRWMEEHEEGPGGADRSGEELDRMEDADYDGR